MKNSVNQIRNTVESFTNVSDQLEERIKGKEGRVLRVPQPDPKKGKKQKQKKTNKYDHNVQKIWGVIGSPKQNFHGIKRKTLKKQHLFEEIIAENSLNQEKK